MKKVLGVVLFFLQFGMIQAQNTDSLRVVLNYETNPEKRLETLYQIARMLVLTTPQTAREYMEEGIVLSQDYGFFQRHADFHYLKAYQAKQLGEYGLAYKHYYLSLKQNEQTGDLLKQAKCQESLGTLLIAQGLIAEAEDRLQEALVGYTEQQAWGLLANLNFRMGNLFKEQDRPHEALDRFQMALAYYSQEGNTLLTASMYEEIGNIYFALDDRSKNATFLDLAESTLGTDEGAAAQRMRASILSNRAFLAYHEGKLAQALDHTEEAIDLFTDFGESYLKRTIYNNAALFSLDLQVPDQALAYLQAAEALRAEVTDDEHFRSLGLQVKAHIMKSDYAAALAVEQLRNQAEVSQKSAQRAQLQARQSAEMQAAQAQLAVMEADAHWRAERQTWALSIAVITLLIGLLVYWMHRRVRYYRAEALRRATHWPELQKRMDALEQTLSMMN